MRRASQNVGVYCEGNNALLSFGYDYCAEHEWGIKGIQSKFGVSNDQEDLTVRRFAVTGDGPLLLVEPKKPRGQEKRIYLLGGVSHFYRETPEEFCESHRGYGDGPVAYWDENTFLFSVSESYGRIKTFRAVHAALMAKDALIYLSGRDNPFGGSGLTIARRSTIERENIEKMEASFRDTKALRDAAEATGIRARVDAWARRTNKQLGAYYALSPKWMFKNREASSKHPVIFWLNPTDQQSNNYGWFTVEELDQWIAGEGPIPMRKENAHV